MAQTEYEKAERKKKLIAVTLGGLALLVLGYNFLGGSSRPQPTKPPKNQNSNRPILTQSPNGTNSTPANATDNPEGLIDLRPVAYARYVAPIVGGSRNIFTVFSEPVNTNVGAVIPIQTPPPVIPPSPPPPPILLASLQPASVYSRTGDVNLILNGDKFTPDVRVYVDGRELPIRYVSAQEITAVIPALVVASSGSKNIVVRTPDNNLFSNPLTLNVGEPPPPNFEYVGLIGGKSDERAILQDKGNKELQTVKQGSVVGGRFRVTKITTSEIELTDTQIGIKHRIAYTDAGGKAPPGVYPPRSSDDGDDSDG